MQHYHYNTVQTTDLVKFKLEDIQAILQNIYTTHRLQDPRNGIRKLKTQIQSLSAIIDIWWFWVDECLAHQDYEVNVCLWVREYLLPVIYWQQQASRTKNPHLKQDYQAANTQANQIFEQHPFTGSNAKKLAGDRQHSRAIAKRRKSLNNPMIAAIFNCFNF